MKRPIAPMALRTPTSQHSVDATSKPVGRVGARGGSATGADMNCSVIETRALIYSPSGAARHDPPRRRPLHQRLTVPRTQHGPIARDLTHEPRMREENDERRVRHEPLEPRQRCGTQTGAPFPGPRPRIADQNPAPTP